MINTYSAAGPHLGLVLTFMTVIGQTETTQNMALFSSQELIKLAASLTNVDSTSSQQKKASIWVRATFIECQC